jgi:hypothetical protein
MAVGRLGQDQVGTEENRAGECCTEEVFGAHGGLPR